MTPPTSNKGSLPPPRQQQQRRRQGQHAVRGQQGIR